MSSPSPNVTFLLGAGASAELGLATSVQLVSQFKAFVRANARDRHVRELVPLIVEELESKRGHLDFEDVLDTFHGLSDITATDIGPLVGRFHETVEKLRRRSPRAVKLLGDMALDFLRNQLTLAEPARFHSPYLSALVRLALRSPVPAIFTLNYDLTIEAVLENSSIDYSTGFCRGSKPSPELLEEYDAYVRGLLNVGEVPVSLAEFFNADLENEFWPLPHKRYKHDIFGFTGNGRRAALRLVKLHGSLDWFRIMSPPQYLGVAGRYGVVHPQDPVKRFKLQQEIPREANEELIIAGRWDKERTQEPYTVLLGEFYRVLMASDVLVIVGYSCSDPHVNRAIFSVVAGDRAGGLSLIVVNGPDWPNRLSPEATTLWTILEDASRLNREREGIVGHRILPMTASQALLGGHLEAALNEVLDSPPLGGWRGKRP